MTHEIPTVELNDGTALPVVGLGTYDLRGRSGVESIVEAIRSGYRLIDSAVNYENEEQVGEAVRTCGVARDDLLVTTKIPGRSHGFDETIACTEESLVRLGLQHIDLLLIHWPLPRLDLYVDTWRALIEVQKRGLVRSIGVSNFTEAMLERIIAETGVTPAVNQIELHPYFPQQEMRIAHERLGIRTESWSPLARHGDLAEEPVLRDLAQKHDVSLAQLVLRWHHQLGSTPIPRSSNTVRQRENLDIFGFELSTEDVETISALKRGRLWGYDPDTHEEM